MDFEWNEAKNAENISKHGLSFYEAQDAFLDKRRVILIDTKHSSSEKRYFCIGKTTRGGMATVRFTIRNSHIRIIGAGYWRKGKKILSNNVNYTDAPEDIEQSLERATIIGDFLPSPEELVRKTAKEKITIALDKSSLELYKSYAKKHNAKYQAMINDVVGAYADKFLK